MQNWKKLILGSTFVLVTSSLYAQEKRQQNFTYSHPIPTRLAVAECSVLEDLTKDSYKKAEYEKTIAYGEKAMHCNAKKKNDAYFLTIIGISYYKNGTSYLTQKKHEEAEWCFAEAIPLLSAAVVLQDSSLMNLTNDALIDSTRQSNYKLGLSLAEQCMYLSSREESTRKRQFIEQGFEILESLWYLKLFQQREHSHDLGLSLLKSYLALSREGEIKDSATFFRKGHLFLETLLQDKWLIPEKRDLALDYRAYIDFRLESLENIKKFEKKVLPRGKKFSYEEDDGNHLEIDDI